MEKATIWVQLIFLIVLLASCGGSRGQFTPNLTMFVDKLPQLPKIRAYSYIESVTGKTHFRIGMYPILWKFHRDLPITPVFAYGKSAKTATVPGPIIEAIQGIPTTITWENYLPKNHILPWDPKIPVANPQYGGVPTVVHLHGGMVPPSSDGSALAWFTNGFLETGPWWNRTTYTYPNAQHPGNLWYHDHALGLTRVNLLAGLLAPYVIKDPVWEASLNLPSGRKYDRHLMIFDRSFNVDGSLYMNKTGDIPELHPQWQPEYFGDAIIVNGKAWPYLKVQRRKYRFRIMNASNARYLRLTLSNGLNFTVIGSDGSYLPSPVSTPSLLLSISEIFDVVIDFSLSTTNETILRNDAPYPFPNGTAINATDVKSKVMKFIISPCVVPDPSQIPSVIKTYNTSGAPPTTSPRYIVLYEDLNPANLSKRLIINNLTLFDPATETPKTGSTEVWEVINLTGDNHPLHLHLAEIQAIKVQQLNNASEFKACMQQLNNSIACNITGQLNGSTIIPVPEYEKTWKNAVKLEPNCVTTVVAKFNLVDNDAPYPFDATEFPGYVYHCHILDHEDNEMIRPLLLAP